MDYKIITPPTVEPLTLAEVKTHLKLDSETMSGDMTVAQSIAPGSHAISAALIGSAVDVLGKITFVNLNAGTCSGNVTAKVRESDDNTNWQDFAAFTTVTVANDNAVQEIDYTGGKRYVRVEAVIESAACDFSAEVVMKTGDVVEDTWLSEKITAAREFCEGVTRRALATQTIEAMFDGFGCKSEIELPMAAPLQSVTSVKYKNSDGEETTMTADMDYIVDTDCTVGRIVLPYGISWPSFTAYTVNPIRIRYVAGYSSSLLIPRMIKQAMLVLMSYWNENRSPDGSNDIDDKTDRAVRRTLSAYRVRWF